MRGRRDGGREELNWLYEVEEKKGRREVGEGEKNVTAPQYSQIAGRRPSMRTEVGRREMSDRIDEGSWRVMQPGRHDEGDETSCRRGERRKICTV